MIVALLPDASVYAGQWDRFFYVLLALSALVSAVVFALVVGFSIRYRRGSSAKRGRMPRAVQNEMEISWTSVTAMTFIFLFWWAAAIQLQHIVPPKQAYEIHVVAKQWMWKVQQPNGVREINQLHAPTGSPVQLIMSSEDAIHSMFLPSLRLKQDVVPGRYTYLWFTGQKPGIYHLLCAEFCGTEHSRMVGKFVLMAPADFSKWLAAQPISEDLAGEGEALFRSLGCSGCHAQNSAVHAPDLNVIYVRQVHLSDGRAVIADEAYLRNSILLPQKDVVAGYEPIMPSFSGSVHEDELIKLIAYLRSLSAGGPQ